MSIKLSTIEIIMIKDILNVLEIYKQDMTNIMTKQMQIVEGTKDNADLSFQNVPSISRKISDNTV